MPTDLDLIMANYAATQAARNSERAAAQLFEARLELNRAEALVAKWSVKAENLATDASAAAEALQDMKDELNAACAAADSASRAR